jgi:hypothetical protein
VTGGAPADRSASNRRTRKTMKTEQHYSPGPWHTQGCTIYSGKNRVAQTWDAEYDGLPTPTMEADAGLIAAAPELQAALDGILQWWMESDGGDDMPVDLFDRAEAALKAARGGAL